jgi:hypothetical protein
MNELITLYFNTLAWMIIHPAQFLFILAAEFIVLYWLYYKSKKNKVLKIIIGIFFQPQNFVFNLFIMSVVGLELPEEWFTTKRLSRWKKLPTDSKLNKWRITVSWKLCALMNKFDPGHC